MSVIQFLGGADEIGRSAMVLDTGSSKMLFEYGLLPTDPPQPPMPAPNDVDALFLTHCHLDHSGMVPAIVTRSDCTLYCTPLTLDLSDLLARDSLKIAKENGYHLPFSKDALRRMYSCADEITFKDVIDCADLEVSVHDAGHIPGAVMYEVNDHDTMLFTGDFNTIETNLVLGARPVKCDTLIMESTYSGREHLERYKVEAQFIDRIHDVVDNGGKVIAPSFAVSRTQEIIMTLMQEKLSVWLDGMGKEVNRIYLEYPEYVRSSKRLKRAIRKTRTVGGGWKRERVLQEADVVVTTSGMLNGGPVLNYISSIKNDPSSAIFLTGYQVEGTNGRMLAEQGMIDFNGIKEKMECIVEQFDFSAHAGHSELVGFARACGPKKLILMHGKADDRMAIANALKGEMDVVLSKPGEKIDI
jgi:putative mRNA 3-end processing factor